MLEAHTIKKCEMDYYELTLLLAVGGVIGWLGKATSGYSRGLLINIGFAFCGAFLGVWISREFTLPVIYTIDFGTTKFPILWALIGSALFIGLYSLLTRRHP